MKKWAMVVTVNFSDGEEIELSFDVDDTDLPHLMGAVAYAMNKELPKYGRGTEEFSSLNIVVVPINYN
jgi:hypothetical protein